jgi:hypothetical protein
MDRKLGTQNARNLYRVASLVTVSKEFSIGGLWHRTCEKIYISLRKGNENHELVTGFCAQGNHIYGLRAG